MDCLTIFFLVCGGLLIVAVIAAQINGGSKPNPALSSQPFDPAPGSDWLPKPPQPRQRYRPQTQAPQPTRSSPGLSIRIDPLSLTEPEDDVDIASFWRPAGTALTIQGYSIPDGMLYTCPGPAPRGSWGQPLEASLVDVSLAVDRSHPDREGENLDYWPKYQALPPSSRAAYLEWLAGGRENADTPIGYVFLFFYGLERRLLTEEPEAAERDALLAEVERLLSIYGDQRSFSGYATGLLETVRWRSGLSLGDLPCDVDPDGSAGWREPPLSVKVALGRAMKAGEAISPELATTWVFNGPFRLRTPALRCPREFRELFQLRYRSAYPKGGLKIRPNKTRLENHYRGASPSFRYEVQDRQPEDLPDITALSAPVDKLQDLVDDVTQELDAYSRFVGRTDDCDSPAALALLPPELAGVRESAESLELMKWLNGHLQGVPRTTVPAVELLNRWPTKTDGKVTKREAEAFAGFCAHRGIGVEPDVRWGGSALHRTDTAVLFSLPEAAMDDEPSDAYRSAALILRLAAAVSAADGDVSAAEEAHLEEHLEEGLDLTPHERLRLRAHLDWLLADPPGFAGIKKAVEPLDESTRRRFGQFLITVAGADGHVDADEVKILRKIYGHLGLDQEAVFSDVHGLMSGEDPSPAAAAGPTASASGTPAPAAEPEGFRLDLEKVRRKREETLEVGGLLEEIFTDDTEPEPTPVTPAIPADDEDRVAGLDGPHSKLLLRLIERESWPRADVERLCAELDLLPDGALEMINEAAFDICGDPLLEGDEVVELDPDIRDEMLVDPAS